VITGFVERQLTRQEMVGKEVITVRTVGGGTKLNDSQAERVAVETSPR